MMNKHSLLSATAELVYDFGTFFKAGRCGDRLRYHLPAIVTSLLVPMASHASFDAQTGGTLRSYPLSGVVETEGGYGMLLRGEANNPFSSYLRAAGLFSTAGIYNSLDGKIEIFPLAILGVRGGGEVIQNDKDYSAYDCNAWKCRGRFYRTYIEAEGTAGYGPAFLQLRWKRERWTQKNPSEGDFIDPTSALAIKGDGDSQTVYLAALGYKINDAFSALAILRYAETDQLGRFSRFPYGVVRYKKDRFSMGLGAGVFESSQKESGLALVGQLRWELAPNRVVVK